MFRIAEIFKAYDIRGIYPSELNEEMAYKIGRAFVTFLGCKKVTIGQDGRLSSPSLFKALAKGITHQGAEVANIGLASTPMLYFGAQGSPASIMITASHNPPEYNGFKLCRENAIPISEATGIKDIEKLVEKAQFKEPKEKGKILKKNIMPAFIAHNLQFVKTDKPLTIVADAGNGMASLTFPKLFKRLPFRFIPLYCEVDFNFPNHEANPLKYETLKDLQKKVVKENADLGVAIDGDADRCVFIDEKGTAISSDLITALIAKELLKKNPQSKILYDLRSSKIVGEFIQQNNGIPIMCRVGHPFIKKQMRDSNALFAGELSGHFYYRDSFFTESSFITTALILNLLAEENKPLSELIAPLKKYHASGEINFTVKDKAKKLKEIEAHYKGAKKIFHLDGLSVEYDNWWFNLRKSNTEPLLRLNLEAKSKNLMQQKTQELLELIRS